MDNIQEQATSLYYDITNTCVEFDDNESPFIHVGDDNKEEVVTLLEKLQNFLVNLMFDKKDKKD